MTKAQSLDNIYISLQSAYNFTAWKSRNLATLRSKSEKIYRIVVFICLLLSNIKSDSQNIRYNDEK